VRAGLRQNRPKASNRVKGARKITARCRRPGSGFDSLGTVSEPRRVSTKVASQLAAMDVPSVVETQAAITAARQIMPICQLAAILRTPHTTLIAWQSGRRKPCAAVRYFVGMAIEKIVADQRRKEKRHREYIRRKATKETRGSANFKVATPPTDFAVQSDQPNPNNLT
jgi:hypothetical protein